MKIYIKITPFACVVSSFLYLMRWDSEGLIEWWIVFIPFYLENFFFIILQILSKVSSRIGE